MNLLAPAVEQVRQAVAERGLTLDEVARRAAVHRRTVKRLLDGERLNEATLRRVAAAVGVRLGLDDPDTEERAKVRELVREVVGADRGKMGQPVTGWEQAAIVLRVSRWTVQRARRRAGDVSRPWWPSREAVLTWWERLLQGRTR